MDSPLLTRHRRARLEVSATSQQKEGVQHEDSAYWHCSGKTDISTARRGCERAGGVAAAASFWRFDTPPPDSACRLHPGYTAASISGKQRIKRCAALFLYLGTASLHRADDGTPFACYPAIPHLFRDGKPC